jgi:hypothetical protein
MINTSGKHNVPPPHSGRILLWYGWRDDPENEDKNIFKNGLSKILFNVGKCYLMELVVIVKQY